MDLRFRSLDSIIVEKSILLEKREECEKLESEYKALINQISMASNAGKYFKIKSKTNLYTTDYFSQPITKFKVGDIVRLIKQNENNC